MMITAKQQKHYSLTQAGFSLLELLVALVLVAVGFIGAMQVQKQVVEGAVDNSQRSVGLTAINELVERMRANSDAISNYQVLMSNFSDPNNSNVKCSSFAPAKDCYQNQCAPTELAQQDVFDVFCGGSGKERQINIRSMNLSCAVSCAQKEEGTLTVVWTNTGQGTDSVSSMSMELRL